jgi:phosphatidylserine/phosphatidylglycerophosphate/cardiolipin synthase-like enzyme
MTDANPEDPRPTGHFGRFRANTWHYVNDDLARSISLGPATDGEPGDDWVLTYTPERRDPENRQKVLVRLTPRALHELYIETKDLTPDARQAGHTAECDLCGDSVELDKAIPNKREEPVHRRCYKDAYGGPVWLE